jgi:hypothetical protein
MAMLAGCEGRDVSVGFVQKGLNLDVCAGSDTDCEPNVAMQTLASPDVQSCDAELEPELELDFTIDVTAAICDDPRRCDAEILALAVAPDATSWVMGTTRLYSQDTESLWVARYDAEGERVNMTDLDLGEPFNGGQVQHKADITVDERGHAFVFVYMIDAGPNADTELAERAWFVELGTNGRPVGSSNLLAGIGAGKIALRDDGMVVVAGNALNNGHYGMLSALTPDGERLWSQTGVRTDGIGVGYGVVGLAAGAGHSLVLSQRSRSGSNGDANTYGLMRFDDSGNAVWDRVLGRTTTFAEMMGDGAGNVLITTNPLEYGVGQIDHVLADGTAHWAHEISNSGSTVDSARGLVYAVTYPKVDEEFRTHDWAHPCIAEITLDDGSCLHRYALPEFANGVSKPAVDALGGLYVADGGTFSRLRLPEE